MIRWALLLFLGAVAAPALADSWFPRASTKAAGSNHGLLGNTGDAGSVSSTGWTVGTKASGNYCLMSFGNVRGSSSFGTTALPAAGPNNTVTASGGDSFRTNSTLNGSYAAGTWSFQITGQASTSAVDGTIGLRVRVWKSVNADGSSATELTTTTLASSAQSAAVGVDGVWTLTWSAPVTTFLREYLFVQFAAYVGTASSTTTAAWVMHTGSAITKIDTPDYAPVTYYIDPAGNDAADGQSSSTAWASLTQINATTLHPGDAVLFKCGQTWTGQFAPTGAGTEAAPVTIGAYGGCEGAVSGFPQLPSGPPIIAGGGVHGESGGAVYLRNFPWVTVHYLEVTNCTDSPCTMANLDQQQMGIYVRASNFGVLAGVKIQNNYVHHVNGKVGSGLDDKDTGCIIVEIYSDSSTPTRFDRLDVSNNKATACNDVNFAISYFPGGYSTMTPYATDAGWYARRVTNFTMRDNDFGDAAKNAVILRLLDGGIIERNQMHDNALRAQSGNTLYTRLVNGTLVQRNEFYRNLATKTFDGSAVDDDLDSVNVTVQWNYIHDNAHGGFWTYTNQGNAGNVFRYNLIVNCHGILYAAHNTGSGVDVFGNLFYQDASAGPVKVIEEKMDSSLVCTVGAPCTYTYRFWNNLVVLYHAGSSYVWMTPSSTKSVSRDISNNLFFGVHPATEPADPHKSTVDPLLAGPFTAPTGVVAANNWSLLNGFRPLSGSPVLHGGKDLRALIPAAVADLWGQLIASDRPDIGAAHPDQQDATAVISGTIRTP